MIKQILVISYLVDQPIGVFVMILHLFDVVALFGGGPVRAQGAGVVAQHHRRDIDLIGGWIKDRSGVYFPGINPKSHLFHLFMVFRDADILESVGATLHQPKTKDAG